MSRAVSGWCVSALDHVHRLGFVGCPGTTTTLPFAVFYRGQAVATSTRCVFVKLADTVELDVRRSLEGARVVVVVMVLAARSTSKLDLGFGYWTRIYSAEVSRHADCSTAPLILRARDQPDVMRRRQAKT